MEKQQEKCQTLKRNNAIVVPPIQQLAKRVIEKKPKKKKKRYDVITYEKRIALLELIIKEKETIKHAADMIGIKLCTAKHILYLYKNQGKIHERREDHQCSGGEDGSLSQEQDSFEQISRQNNINTQKKTRNLSRKQDSSSSQHENKTCSPSISGEQLHLPISDCSQNKESNTQQGQPSISNWYQMNNTSNHITLDFNQLSFLMLQSNLAMMQFLTMGNEQNGGNVGNAWPQSHWL